MERGGGVCPSLALMRTRALKRATSLSEKCRAQRLWAKSKMEPMSSWQPGGSPCHSVSPRVPSVSPPSVSPALPRDRNSSAPAYLPSKKTVRLSELKARHIHTSTTSMAPATTRQGDGDRDGGTGTTGLHGATAQGWVSAPTAPALGAVTSPVGLGWPLVTVTSPVRPMGL